MYTSIICWSYISLSLCFISWTWVKYFHSELYSTALTNHCNRPQPILYICREYSKMEIKFRFFTQWYWYQVFNFKEFLGYYKSMFFFLGVIMTKSDFQNLRISTLVNWKVWRVNLCIFVIFIISRYHKFIFAVNNGEYQMSLISRNDKHNFETNMTKL